MIQTIDDIVIRVKVGMGTSASLLTEEGYEFACNEALNELNYTLPLSNGFKSFWLVKRARRHVLFILYTESANRFQYKQIRLNHRWEHYHKMIQSMDAEFSKALENDWMDFLDDSPSKVFGTKIDAGFAYDKFGRERTYDFANYVNFTP